MPNDLVGLLQGRSSLGRLGVIIHATAGFIDPGYKGIITLELSNLGHLPVKLYPLQRVATIGFITIKGKVTSPYGTQPNYLPLELNGKGKYKSMKTEPSKINKDWENDLLRIKRDDFEN
jgi:deoxycytidine triphosphate deaminase